MNYLALIQIIAFYGYVLYVWNKIGIQKSISESWYTLPIDNRNYFVFFAAGSGLPLWAYGMYQYSGLVQMLFVLSGLFMFCISVASTFKASTLNATIHNACTALAISFAFGAIYLQYHDIRHLVAAVVGSLLLLAVKNRVWWIEIWVFTTIITRLILIE